MPAVQDSWAGLPYTPKPTWTGCRARPRPNPPGTPGPAPNRSRGGQLMFSRAGAGPRHGAAEGNVGQHWEVCSTQGGGVGVSCSNPSLPASYHVCEAGWGSPGGGPGALPRAWVADGWGAGERGAREDRGRLSAQMTVASLFKRHK